MYTHQNAMMFFCVICPIYGNCYQVVPYECRCFDTHTDALSTPCTPNDMNTTKVWMSLPTVQGGQACDCSRNAMHHSSCLSK